MTYHSGNLYNMNIGQYPGNPPPENATDTECRIREGPKNSKTEALTLLAAVKIRYMTIKCINDVSKLGLDQNEVATLVKEAILYGKFKGSIWCRQDSGGPSAICDAYVLNRKEWNEASKKELIFEYYVKFAIGRSRNILFLMSCHT